MTNGDPRDGFFYPTLTPTINSYIQRGYNATVVLILGTVHMDVRIVGEQGCDAWALSIRHLSCLRYTAQALRTFNLAIICKMIATHLNSYTFVSQECTVCIFIN